MAVVYLWCELVNTHVFILDGESYLSDVETHGVGKTDLTTTFYHRYHHHVIQAGMPENVIQFKSFLYNEVTWQS